MAMGFSHREIRIRRILKIHTWRNYAIEHCFYIDLRNPDDFISICSLFVFLNNFNTFSTSIPEINGTILPIGNNYTKTDLKKVEK